MLSCFRLFAALWSVAHQAPLSINEKGIPTDVAEVTRKPEMTVNITDPKVASQVLRLVDRMEDIDDVQQVTANYVIDDSIADQIEE